MAGAEMMAKLGLDQSSYEAGLSSATRSADKFAAGLSRSMTALGGTIAGAFAFDKIMSGFNGAIEKGDQLQDLANRFGVSASALQEIGNTASLSGASLEDVASAMGKLAKNAGEAVAKEGEMRDAFADIGLSVEDLKRMSPEDLFYALSEAVASGKLGMEKFSVVTQLAGRSAGSLMEVLEMGPAAIRENGSAMGTWSDETIAALSEASDNIKKFQNNFTIMFGSMIPVIDRVISKYQDFVEAIVLRGNANRNPGLDSLGQAALLEEAGKLVSGKAGRTQSPSSPTQKNASAKAANQGELESDRRQKKKDAEELAKFKKEIELKNGDYAKNLMDEAAADEKRRNRELQFKREDFQRGLDQARLEAVKMEKTRAENEARIPRRLQGAFGSAASDILGVAGQAGSPYAGIVNRLQKQSDEANLKRDVADLEAKAMAMVADRGQMGPGLIDPRNKYGGLKSKQTIVEEFLTQQQGKKDAGRRTLDDIYQVLDDALREITSTPRVGAN